MGVSVVDVVVAVVAAEEEGVGVGVVVEVEVEVGGRRGEGRGEGRRDEGGGGERLRGGLEYTTFQRGGRHCEKKGEYERRCRTEGGDPKDKEG